MHQKSIEVIFTLPLLQNYELKEEDISFINEFLSTFSEEDVDSSENKELIQILQSQQPFPVDSAVLKVQRIIDYMDHSDLLIVYHFIEAFLSQHSLYSYHATQFIKYCGELLQQSSGVHINQNNFPKLFVLLENLSNYAVSLHRLDVTRSQIAAMRRGAKGSGPLPLGEIIIQLAMLYSCLKHTDDEDYAISNMIIRFARLKFTGLSFQQIMRVCKSVNEIISNDIISHLFFCEQIAEELNYDTKEELIVKCIQIRNRLQTSNVNIIHLIDSVIQASRLSEDEMGKILFLYTNNHDDLPGYFDIWDYSGDQNARFSLPTMDQSTAVKDANPKSEDGILILETDKKNHSVKAKIQCSGQSKEYEFKDGEAHYIDNYCLIFKPSAQQMCCYRKTDSSLFVSHIDLEYRGNRILNDISMVAHSGEMIALVGPSGCGKSTMLTMLSGILNYTRGDIFFDGRRISSMEDFAEISTYIPQDDILFRELTVHESIRNSLKLKVKCENAEVNNRISNTIDVLDLKRTEFLKIGNEGEKGISGGQRKRVNIGTTIVAEMKPILLFDEPTSGLDPATDIEIMQLLRQLSRSGHIVLCVTHNLSPESISYFDKLMVLGKSGQMQFFGKIQRALYFFSIKSTQVLFQKMKDSPDTNFNEKLKKSPEYTSLENGVELETQLIAQKSKSGNARKKVSLATPSAPSNFVNFFKRELIRKSRDSQFLLTCLIQPLLIGLFISWNFIGPLPNALFSLITASLWIGAISGVREINSEIPHLKRDYMYGTSLVGYFISKILSCLCFSATQVILLGSLVMINGSYLTEPFNFSYSSLCFHLLLLNLFGICLGLFLSTAIRSTLAAVGILPVILIPLIIMGGALIKHNQTSGLQWAAIKYNPLRTAFEASMYSAQNILRPQFNKLEKRDAKDGEEQKNSWQDYQKKIALFHEDIASYKEKYTEQDVNDLFSDMLEDDDAEEEETPEPQKPINVVEPELLLEHPNMWLLGYAILPVDHAPKGHSLGANYPVLAPKAFSEKLSAQGASGMYQDVSGQSVSTYSAFEYIFIPFFEIFLLIIAMYFFLRHKLSSKF
ncbi:MAG: ATP-binding cassette domain-containing protein [Planctomycetes bacterium]|nr:ATP-binding cassette domain-containing protein [Planctomycetota bacterium]